MAAPVLVVHDQGELLNEICDALGAAGHEVVRCSGSMEALCVLDDAGPLSALITRVRFPRGQPNGVALARMARTKRHDIKIVFFADPQFEGDAEGLGDFVDADAEMTKLVEKVDRLVGLAR